MPLSSKNSLKLEYLKFSMQKKATANLTLL